MPENNFQNRSTDIVGEACAWIAQLETGDMSQADMRAFEEWVGRSPVHFTEIHRLAKLSAYTNTLSDMAVPISHASKERRAAIMQYRFGGRFLRQTIMTSVALFVFLVAGLAFYLSDRTTYPFMLETAIGGFQEMTLSDGSTVKLNTASQLEVDFDKSHRRIRLLKGEALFDVAKNPYRPFIVYADDKIVRAIGTAFAVRWTDGDLSVTVSEGKVQFAPVTADVAPISIKSQGSESEAVTIVSVETPLYLQEGQKLSIPDDRSPTLVAGVTERYLQSELAWQSGLWDFADRPLTEVIEEVRRFTEMKIEYSETELQGMKFTGMFWTNNVVALLEGLDLDESIEIEHISKEHVRINLERF